MREYEMNNRQKVVVWVWERMHAFFGDQWVKKCGPVWDPKREKERRKKPHLWPRLTPRPRGVATDWAKLLDDLHWDAVTRAVDRVCVPGRSEIPTLREFITLCVGDDGHVERRRPTPEPETDDQRMARLERGGRELGGLKAMLGSQSEKAA